MKKIAKLARSLSRVALWRAGVAVLAIALVVFALAFGFWSTTTRNESLFGRQTSLAAIYSFVLAVLVAAAAMLGWVRRSSLARHFVPHTGRWRLVPVDACSAGEVRVHAAAGPNATLPPYVSRDHDKELRERLRATRRDGGFVLLAGGSSTGKSRSLFEAVHDVFQGWQILLPASANAVRDAASAGAISPRTVVWLDDTPTEKYITAAEGGLTAHDVRELLSVGPVVIVDSIWPTRYQALTAQPRLSVDEITPPDPFRDSRDALNIAGEPIRVPEQFSPRERAKARHMANKDQRLMDALSDTQFGFTQTLAGAPTLIRRYRDAESAEPYAYAVMTAAIDARRLGRYSRLSKRLLQDAAVGYLTPRQRAAIIVEPSGSAVVWFESALAYATDPHSNPGNVAPLIAEPSDSIRSDAIGYTIADYLLQYSQYLRRDQIVPASTWEALLRHTIAPADLARVASAADSRLLYGYALPMYRAAAASGNMLARMELAQWLAEHDHFQELESRAYAGEDFAVFQLDFAGRGDAAIAALQQRADSGDDEARHELASRRGIAVQTEDLRRRADTGDEHAKRELAARLASHGETDELRQRADAGDEHARYQLAAWLVSHSETDELRQRADAGDEEAKRELAAWLVSHGEIDELRQRADAGDEHARRELADFLASNGLISEAITVIQPLANARDKRARWFLAKWQFECNQVDEMRQRADDGDEDAELHLIQWLFIHNQADELRQRADAGSKRAQWRLAEWLISRTRIDELRVRADAGDDGAASQLAQWLFEHEQIDELRKRAQSGSGIAGQQLAEWLAENGRIEELRQRADSGDEHAERRLADWLFDHDRINELRERANFGGDNARRQLAELLGRHKLIDELCQRAVAGDERAGRRLKAIAKARSLEGANRLIKFGLNLDGSIATSLEMTGNA